jgi:hypothetical protein
MRLPFYISAKTGKLVEVPKVDGHHRLLGFHNFQPPIIMVDIDFKTSI